MKKILFIHRSVGSHLLKYGDLRQLLNDQGMAIDDYDNNRGLLTYNDGTIKRDVIKMPGNNTNPQNLAQFFNEWTPILDRYDLIVIKSCYPNSHIKDQIELKKIKETYNSIFDAFKKRRAKLFVLTTPPLRPNRTTANEARLASQLALWLAATFDQNVFDLHTFLSKDKGVQKGMLKRKYRRLRPWDTHPNNRAHRALSTRVSDAITH